MPTMPAWSARPALEPSCGAPPKAWTEFGAGTGFAIAALLASVTLPSPANTSAPRAACRAAGATRAHVGPAAGPRVWKGSGADAIEFVGSACGRLVGDAGRVTARRRARVPGESGVRGMQMVERAFTPRRRALADSLVVIGSSSAGIDLHPLPADHIPIARHAQRANARGAEKQVVTVGVTGPDGRTRLSDSGLL